MLRVIDSEFMRATLTSGLLLTDFTREEVTFFSMADVKKRLDTMSLMN